MQKLFSLLVGCLGICTALAQSPESGKIVGHIIQAAAGKPQTLVYLQTSKGIFQRGEDIWLKAYVMDPQTLAPVTLDTTLFVQLRSIDSARVIAEGKILIDNGFASGQLPTRNTIPGAEYLLAAFTPHAILNDSSEFKAFRRIKIADNTTPSGLPASTDSVRLDFFPEGGTLLAGVANLVAFKASKTGGQPLQVSAALFENGRQIMQFSSNRLGTGKFQFIPKQTAAYTVTIGPSGRHYNLPDASREGIALHLVNQSDTQFTFRLTKASHSNYDRIYVSAQVRGIVCALFQGKMKGDSLLFTLPAAKLPQGIAQVTVYDQSLRPLAERLIFAHLHQNLVVRATLSQQVFRPREKVKLNIKVTDAAGTPVVAHLGVSVYDQFYRHTAERLNIISYTHLHSQIRGAIPDPDYYFNPNNKDREEALDLLLLTQGWRRYVWTTPEAGHAGRALLSNRMTGQLTGKRGLPNMLLAFGPDGAGIQNPIVVGQDGRFALSIENMLLGRMYLKALGNAEQATNVKINLDDPFAQIGGMLAEKQLISPAFSATPPDSGYRSAMSRSIVLDEFVVTGKGRSYSDGYMQSLDSLAKFGWNTDFVGECQWLNCISCGHGKKPVEGVAYSKFRDGSPARHGSFNPQDVVKEPYKYPVYTEEELLAKFHLTRAIGYQARKEFYQPDYEDDITQTGPEDERNTLLWNPAVITNEKGEATLEFYCSDITGRFVGNIEGLDGNGKLAASEFGFTVQDSSNAR